MKSYVGRQVRADDSYFDVCSRNADTISVSVEVDVDVDEEVEESGDGGLPISTNAQRRDRAIVEEEGAI